MIKGRDEGKRGCGGGSCWLCFAVPSSTSKKWASESGCLQHQKSWNVSIAEIMAYKCDCSGKCTALYNDSYTKRILCKYNLTLHNNTIQVLIVIIQSVKFVWRCGEVLLRAVQSNLAAVAAVHAAHSLVGPVWGVRANTKEHALWWSGPQPSMPTTSSLLNICKYLWVLTAVHVHGLLTCNFIIISICIFLHTSTEKCILIIQFALVCMMHGHLYAVCWI